MSFDLVWPFVATFVLISIWLFIWIGHRYNGANWGNPWTNILDGWIRLYCQKFHRQGNQKIDIPEVPRILLACNHLSAIDPFLLITATNRPIRFMIAKEEYERPLLKWMFKAAGCIPVDRNGRVEAAFRSALRAIKSGEILALFPQGGIHSEETPRLIIKPGMAKLSQLSGCPILPVRINGIAAPGTMLASVIKRSRIVFDVAPVVTPEQTEDEAFREQISQWFLGNVDLLGESSIK
jgi:1-acyl-sn-glycerol-3-phosphate acyltransferase